MAGVFSSVMEQALTEPQDQDRPLFEALAAGDEGALSELMQRHGRWVRGVVFAVLGPCDELDDVVQKVWLNAWRRAGSLEDVSRWRYWLYRLAHNAAIDAGRKRQRRRGLWKRFTAAMGPRQVEARGPGAQRRLEQSEQHKRVLAAIHGLPEIYREPFVLRHLEEWSYREIAQAMDLPVDTVETRLVRARRLLREALASLREP